MQSLLPDARKVDALATLSTGLGEDERVAQVLKAWQSPGCLARFCFIAGQNQREKFAEWQTVESLTRRYGLTRYDGLIVQPSAEHTRHQAEWVCEQVVHTGATSVAVYAPHYHLLRAWLTFVQEIVFRNNLWIPVLPVQVIVSPFDTLREYEPEVVAKWELIAGEFARIRTYTAKGDVANFSDAFRYIEWLWKNC